MTQNATEDFTAFFYTCVPKEQETKQEKGRNPGDKDDGKYNPEPSESSLDNVDTSDHQGQEEILLSENKETAWSSSQRDR